MTTWAVYYLGERWLNIGFPGIDGVFAATEKGAIEMFKLFHPPSHIPYKVEPAGLFARNSRYSRYFHL